MKLAKVLSLLVVGALLGASLYQLNKRLDCLDAKARENMDFSVVILVMNQPVETFNTFVEDYAKSRDARIEACSKVWSEQ